jgi:hypothetical protein
MSRTRISFSVFCVEVLIIGYDKMVSHMMPTCALYSSSKACDPGKDLPYHSSDGRVRYDWLEGHGMS